VSDWSKKLKLTNLSVFDNLSFNYVLTGFRNGQPAVLKIGLDYEALNKEAIALETFANHGAVKILAKDKGVLLIQQAVPGVSLKQMREIDNASKIKICCELTAKLHYSQPKFNHIFPKISDWLKALDKEWQIPEHYLTLARKLRDKLLNSTEPQILLHGDLHHDNILKHREGWLIIDPKGVIGYPINEVWAFIIDIEVDTKFIAEFFNYDLTRVRFWYFTHLILAACWCLEDNLAPDKFMELATKTYKLFNFDLIDINDYR
jgi:streptomycin 6-kinase